VKQQDSVQRSGLQAFQNALDALATLFVLVLSVVRPAICTGAEVIPGHLHVGRGERRMKTAEVYSRGEQFGCSQRRRRDDSNVRAVARSCSVILAALFLPAISAFAQGGPPYYTNDPGTPGNLNWEINVGYMPFFYSNRSVSHTPDVDINFGIGDRIQLTYENAWLRVQNPSSTIKYGLGQSNPGVKWRFYDAGESGLSIAAFPQLFLNNPNDAVRRGITSASEVFLLPFEFTKKLGPIDVDYEVGYQFVHKGPNGWLTGLVLGHDFTPKLEGDIELYNQGSFHPSENEPTIGFGARYKIHRPAILLFMAGRGLEPARNNQPYFVGYFGVQFLLPPKSYKADLPEDNTARHATLR
jgi:hypothetical protein